jgi:hypothetical protein
LWRRDRTSLLRLAGRLEVQSHRRRDEVVTVRDAAVAGEKVLRRAAVMVRDRPDAAAVVAAVQPRRRPGLCCLRIAASRPR